MPARSRQRHVEAQRGQRHGARGVRRRTEVGVNLQRRQRADEAPEECGAFEACRRHCARVEPGARAQHDQFEREAQAHMAPQTEADLGGVVVQRQVGDVHRQVEKPVREGSGRDQQQDAAAALPDEDGNDSAEQQRQRNRSRQAVRVGHVVEIERVGFGEAGRDPQPLDAQQHQDRPDHIQPLHGDEPHPQRHAPGGRLDRERNAVVTDEHAVGGSAVRPLEAGASINPARRGGARSASPAAPGRRPGCAPRACARRRP